MFKNQIQQSLQRGFQLLQSGKKNEASALAENICASNPNNVDALHLSAICRNAVGDRDGSEQHYKRALQIDKKNFQITCNYANLLSAVGKYDMALVKYQKTVKLKPDFINGWLGLGYVATSLGKLDEAKDAYEKVTHLQPKNSLGWQGLGTIYRDQDRLLDAKKAFEKAVHFAPENAAAWINLGVVERMLGDLDVASKCFDKAEKAGFKGPELMDGKASILLDKQRPDESIEIYRQICLEYPHYIAGHDALSRILYENDSEADATSTLHEAIKAQPDNYELRFKLVSLLFDMERFTEALEAVSNIGLPADDIRVMSVNAMLFDQLGDAAKAGQLFESILKQAPDNLSMLHAFARYLLRTKEIDQAGDICQRAIKLDPLHQMSWAYQGDVWRLQGDQREEWLHGYERFIQPCEIDIPDGFDTVKEFCSVLESAIRPMHAAQREPVNQSLRNGSQTSGNLFGHSDPMVVKIRESIRSTLIKQVDKMPDDDAHPMLSRKSTMLNFAGAWSVLLNSTGHHINHIHSRGWLSSAFYLYLPPVVDNVTETNEGWIQFGQPPLDLGLDLEPRKFIKPKVGSFAYFPSYTWHGTVPFNDEAERMTISYDVVPA